MEVNHNHLQEPVSKILTECSYNKRKQQSNTWFVLQVQIKRTIISFYIN